jgi:hypothetical protein
MSRWTEQVDVPAIWTIAAGQTPPRLCARHGEPAEETRVVKFYQKKMPRWIWIGSFLVGLVATRMLGLVIGLALALLAGALLDRMRPGIEVEAWPYCMRCIVLHRAWVTGTAARLVGFGGILIGVMRFPAEGFDPSALLLIAGGYLLVLTGLVGARFSWRRLAGANASMDQATLHVEAHGRFAADIRERLAAERASAAA